MKNSHLGKVPNTAMSIETDLELAPKMKVSSAIVVITYRALTFSKGFGMDKMNSRGGFHVFPCSVASRNLKKVIISIWSSRLKIHSWIL